MKIFVWFAYSLFTNYTPSTEKRSLLKKGDTTVALLLPLDKWDPNDIIG